MAQDQYRCGECGATFSSKAGLEEHNRMTHSRYTCEACGAILTSERDLEEHNREVHPEMEKNRR
jgi:DNA-directed RNA polymerase subunit RPC12/RpoP